MPTIDELIKSSQQAEIPSTETVEDTDDVVGEMTGDSLIMDTIKNIPSSAVQFGKDIITPVLSPIQTAKSIGELSESVIALVKPGEQGNEELARQVGNFYAQRYGSLENIQRTVSQDPVGFLGDLALLFTGAGGVAKLGKATTVAEKAAKASKLVDPLTYGTKAVTKPLDVAGRGVRALSGTVTGTGTGPLKQALMGGEEFTAAMRGRKTEGDILQEAEKGLESLKSERSNFFKEKEAEFLPQMKATKVDAKTKQNILDQVKDYRNTNTIARGEKTDTVLKRIERVLSNPENKINNVADIDKIRRQLNQVEIPKSGPERAAYSEITNNVRTTLERLAPKGYTDFLTDYGSASKAIEEVVKELSVGGRGSRQTAINKLLRILTREQGIAAQTLNKLPNAEKLMELLSGYSLSSAIPSGLSRGLTAGLFQTGVLGGATAGSIAGGTILPGLIGLAAVSPRLAGEATRAIGQARKGISAVTPSRTTAGLLRQVGATQEEMERQGLL